MSEKRGVCVCGRHSTQLEWTESMRRLAGEALIETFYGAPEKATDHLQKLLAEIPETCSTGLIERLRKWRDAECPQSELFWLTKALTSDSDIERFRAAS